MYTWCRRSQNAGCHAVEWFNNCERLCRQVMGCRKTTVCFGHEVPTQDPCQAERARRSRRWRLDHESSARLGWACPCNRGSWRQLRDQGRGRAVRVIPSKPQAYDRRKISGTTLQCGIQWRPHSCCMRHSVGRRSAWQRMASLPLACHAKDFSAKPHEQLHALFCRIGSAGEGTGLAHPRSLIGKLDYAHQSENLKSHGYDDETPWW